MGVVAVLGLVFDMRCGNRDPTGFFLGCSVDLVVGFEIAKILRDRCCQCCLAVVNVTNLDVRLVTFKLCLCHRGNHRPFGGGEAPILSPGETAMIAKNIKDHFSRAAEVPIARSP